MELCLNLMYDDMGVKVIIDEHIPFIKGVIEPFALVQYYPGANITASMVKEADALIVRTRTYCNADLLSGSNVKVIASATIGYDHIDIEYCKKNNIRWFTAKGCNTNSVLQYVIAALYHLSSQHCFNLTDKILGIVGVGNIGSRVKAFADTIKMKTLLCDPPLARRTKNVNFFSLHEVLKNADIITFHVPLEKHGNNATYHLINDNVIPFINNKYLINTSRGAVFSGTTLLKLLKKDRLKGLVLDVWENEPNVNNDLLRHSLLATPHIAGYTADGKARATELVVRGISEYFNWPLNCFKVEKLPYPQNHKHSFFIESNDVNFNLSKIITEVYNIDMDSEQLKQSPFLFEDFRNNYGIRREFCAYTVKGAGEICNKLTALGFTYSL